MLQRQGQRLVPAGHQPQLGQQRRHAVARILLQARHTRPVLGAQLPELDEYIQERFHIALPVPVPQRGRAHPIIAGRRATGNLGGAATAVKRNVFVLSIGCSVDFNKT
jgi:hypothetical protein